MKKTLLTVLQFAITGVALWIVFRDPVKRAEMGRTLAKADHWWLLLGVATYGLVELVGAIRWHILLRVQDIRLSPVRTLWLVMIGVFYNFIIPGGTGGDVVKAFYLLKETAGQRALALLSIFVDRAFGLVSLIAVAGCFLAVRWNWLTATPDAARASWTAAGILAALAGIFLFTIVVTRFRLLDKLPKRFPGREKLGEAGLAVKVYGRARSAMFYAPVLSLLSHAGTFFTFYCAARALAEPDVKLPSLLDLSAIIPVVNTIAALPISVAGIGVREGLFQVFLGQVAGLRDSLAVLISSTGWMLSVFWGVVGGVLYAFYRPSREAMARDAKAKEPADPSTVTTPSEAA